MKGSTFRGGSVIAFAIWACTPAHAQSTTAGEQQAPEQQQGPVAPGLQEEAATSDDIIVTGQRGSLNAARQAEREAVGVTNVITADDAGQFADQNIAEALQRLPGVSIERSEGEGRFVSVRGLDPAFNNVTLNGVRLGSTEKGNSAVALDLLPSDLLDTVAVSKTPTPDQDGDAIGGTIEIKTLSAFDRKNQIQLRAEASYNEIAEKFSPKFTASLTRLFADDTIAFAIAGSYFGRKVQSDQLTNSEGLRCVRAGAATNALAVLNVSESGCDQSSGYFLRPQELDVRVKIGERERIGGTVNLEWRPGEDQLMYIRATHSRLTDTDNRFQEETEFRRVTDRRDIISVGPRTGVQDGIRYETQIFQQQIKDRVWVGQFGGQQRFGNTFVDFQQDYSKTTRSSPGSRVRFQGRNGLSTYTLDGDSIEITSGTGRRRPTNTSFTPTVGSDPSVPANLLYEQLFFDDEEGEDEIYQTSLNVRQELGGSLPGFLKAGFRYREREKQTDVNEFDFSARSAPLNRTESLASFELFTPKNTNLPFYLGQFPRLGDINEFIGPQQELIRAVPGVLVNSTREDYVSEEKVTAAYAMASLKPVQGLTIVGGLRVERTTFETNGNFVFDSDGSTFVDTVVAIPTARKKFTEYLPSVIVRYEPTPELQFRAAFSEAIQRPNFDDTRNVQSALDDGTTRSIDLQNPSLDPARARQFDASVAWYPNPNTGLTLGGFYKRISDFIVDTELQDVDIRTIANGAISLPSTIPGGFTFNNVSVALNGDVGKIYGVELAYSQSYTFLPGFLRGLFSNFSATYAKSEADIAIREGTFAFPGQPKWVVNGSLGYEDKRFSLRGSATYKDDTLESISSVSPLDEVRTSFLQIDANARFFVTPEVQVYFDASNLTNAKDKTSYRGDANGRFFSEIERFGRTFQLGVRTRF